MIQSICREDHRKSVSERMIHMIELIGIGTGEREDITIGALEKMKKAKRILLQTENLPIASFFREQGISYMTMDDWYEGSESFDDLYEHIRDIKDGTTVCILGDIFSSMFAKEMMKNHSCRIYPGLGPASVTASVSGGTSGAKGILMTNGYDFCNLHFHGNEDTVITEIDSQYLASEVILKLMQVFNEEKEVFLVRGKVAEKKTLSDLYDIKKWDYSTSVFVPGGDMSERVSHSIEDLEEVMDRLLGIRGCPWDKAQTHESLRSYLMEETLETIDAIDSGDPFQLEEELGDLLYQLIFHSKLSEKHGEFGFTDVVTGIVDKLIRRHPHVFLEQKELPDWEKEKLEEKHETLRESVDRIPGSFSEVMRFGKMLKKLKAFGTRLPTEDELLKRINSMTGNGRDNISDKDLLLSVLLLFWLRGFDPELAVRDMNRDLKKRIMEEKDGLNPVKSYGCGDFTEENGQK